MWGNHYWSMHSVLTGPSLARLALMAAIVFIIIAAYRATMQRRRGNPPDQPPQRKA